jgi:hydrogenase-4 component B
MQYTSGSFAGIVADWFRWIFLPQRLQRRPRGVFPKRGHRVERVPETVLERVIEPTGRAVMRLARAARQLQHGRLQFYILYVAGGLTVLAVIAWLGETP